MGKNDGEKPKNQVYKILQIMEHYIDKSAIVAEIKRQILAIDKMPKITDTQISVLSGNKVILTKLLSFIDTLEVKNGNLKDELKRSVNGAMMSAENSLNKTKDKSDYICYKIFKYLKENM